MTTSPSPETTSPSPEMKPNPSPAESGRVGGLAPDRSAPEQPGQWHAIHIYYTSDSGPMLTECVAPLVRELRQRRLISRYFFINYWLEGPHVRLRLKPATVADTAEVCLMAETAIQSFLDRRPALYEADSEFLLDFYEEMFRLEYSEEERAARFGGDGPMPMRDNNSYIYLPYEPEYDKYGGVAGVDLAEWHFEHSSDLVLRLVATANVHLRTVRLGLSAQLMMIMTSAFLRDTDRMAEFLERYHNYWHNAFETVELGLDTRYDSNYAQMADNLWHRFAEIHRSVSSGQLDRLTGFGQEWAAHCVDLRERVAALAGRKGLVFPVWDGTAPRASLRNAPLGREPVTDPEAAMQILLSPYLHMTNNRLGATITDEAYLSYLLARTLRERAVEQSPVGGP